MYNALHIVPYSHTGTGHLNNKNIAFFLGQIIAKYMVDRW